METLPTPSAIADQGDEVVPIEHAADAVLAALRGRPQAAIEIPDGAPPELAELIAENDRLRAGSPPPNARRPTSERQLERYAADLRETFKSERDRAQQLTRSYMATVRALSNAVEARDAYTGKHAERVTALRDRDRAASSGCRRLTRRRSSSASCCTMSASWRSRTRSCSSPVR